MINKGYWEVKDNGVKLRLNPCGAMTGNDLHSGCIGSLACAENEKKTWNQVSPLSHPVVTSITSGFSLLYSAGSSAACPLDRKDVETRLKSTLNVEHRLELPNLHRRLLLMTVCK